MAEKITEREINFLAEKQTVIRIEREKAQKMLQEQKEKTHKEREKAKQEREKAVRNFAKLGVDHKKIAEAMELDEDEVKQILFEN